MVFDLDGTLVDSRRDLAESINALLVECGHTALPEEAVGCMVGDGAATLVARAFAAAGTPAPPDALERFLRLYDPRLLLHTRPYDGVPALLSALSSRTRLAVLTNKPLGATHRVLEGLALAPHFPPAWVVGGDGPWPRKPDPSGLRYLMGAAGVSALETMLVGDSIIDLRTARAAGAIICLARYGFGYESIADDQRGADDLVIDRPLTLVDALGWKHSRGIELDEEL